MPDNKQPTTSPSGKWFTGLVDSADASTYLLNICPIDKDSISFAKIAGVAISTCFANSFGFRDCDLIQPGSTVLCYLLQPHFCLVIGTVPHGDIGVLQYPARALLGAGDAIVDDANLQGYQKDMNKSILMNCGRPTDVVDGEKVWANDYGVTLQLLSFMASLKGSDLAQIQCHLLDDLVRIISHNWEHNTAMGDFKVFHDGKSLHAEFQATASPTEAQGIPEVDSFSTEPIFEPSGQTLKDDSKDFYQFEGSERTQQIARFKMFLGKLGDFVNLIVSRPTDSDAARDLQGTVPNQFDTGLSQVRMAIDGGIYARTIKEVFIEKTNWIRVPQRIRTPEDPNGDDGTKITFDLKKLYEFDNSYQYQNNPYLQFLQLRNYVAYMNGAVAYQNFLTQAKDFAVSTDLSKETKLDAITSIDPDTPINLQDYALRNSGVYLLQDGSITLKDAWGSAIVLSGGNIYLQPAKDLVMQPLRNVVAKVGQYINLACQYDIDLSSTSGGIRFKADQALYAYSANSGIVLQADGTNATAGALGGTAAVEGVDGIVLKSKLGIYNFAQQVIANITPQDFIVKAGQDVRLDAQGTAQFSATSDAIIYGSQNASLISGALSTVASTGTAILSGTSSTVLGQKGQQLGVVPPPNQTFASGIQGLLDTDQLVNAFDEEVLQDTDLLDLASPFSDQSSIDNLNFRFLNTDDYELGDDKAEVIPMTLSQQEDQTSGIYRLVPWVEKLVNGTLPFPGADNFFSAYASTSGSIPNLQQYNGYDYTGKAASVNQNMPVTMNSLNNYTVQN